MTSIELLVRIFLKGIILGFLSSIPLGPIGIICIQRTLGKGRLHGFVSGLGAATADTMLAIIAGLGISFIINFITGQKIYFQIVGGILVLIIGLNIFFKSPVKQVRERHLKKNNLWTDYLSVLILTLSNPLAIFLFLTIFAGLNLVADGSENFLSPFFLFTGIFCGASLWWFTLSSLVSRYRSKFRLRSLWWLNKITGLIIFLLGLVAIISVLFIK